MGERICENKYRATRLHSVGRRQTPMAQEKAPTESWSPPAARIMLSGLPEVMPLIRHPPFPPRLRPSPPHNLQRMITITHNCKCCDQGTSVIYRATHIDGHLVAPGHLQLDGPYAHRVRSAKHIPHKRAGNQNQPTHLRYTIRCSKAWRKLKATVILATAMPHQRKMRRPRSDNDC